MRTGLLRGLCGVLLGICMGGASGESVARSALNEARFTPEELRADFVQMYRGLKAAHFDLYAFTSKRELDRRYAQVLSKIDRPMTKLEAKVLFELFAAEARMGHTRLDSPTAEWNAYRKNGGKGFPLTIRIVDEHAYLAGNLSGVDAIRPGDEITRLNGLSIASWLKRTERHVSAETSYMADSIMEYDFAIYLWVELGAVDAFDIVTRRGALPVQRTRLPARSSEEMEAALGAQAPGLDLESPLRDAKLLDGGVAYLRPGPFYNAEAKTGADEWDVSGFREFIDHAFNEFLAAGASRLIIDLRGNPGGDNLFSDVMVSWFAAGPFRFASQFKIKVSAESVAANAARIAHDAEAAGPVSRRFADLYARSRIGDVVDFAIPEASPRAGKRFEGKVFVLINRQSYSNAVAVAALVQDYRFGVIVGEATSDMATTYGAMEQFALNHTGLEVGYPKARLVRPNGDLRSPGVTPDIPIRVPVVQSPRDEVLQQAIAIARR
ncbi:MAG TPA: S41 family peptidase [Steroidobacteraceae bacterium]|nr:S41 family peptidase [Steroidobacteraceae bacterium]